MDLSYIINELGEDREQYYQAIAPPIIQSSNFAFRSVDAFREGLADEYGHWIYSRGNNPTVDILRRKLAALDGAEDALVFGSGIAAIVTPMLANLSAGDHVLSVGRPYSWTMKFFDRILPRFGISVSYVDGTRVEHFEQELRDNTRLIYLESPNTFTYELQDLAGVAALAGGRGILTLIDNSYCSPLYQKPIAMGIDFCAQTATKFIGGHSDTVAGVLTGSRDRIKKIFDGEFMNFGGTVSPLNAWLLIRGLRTLEIRLERICSSTAKITDVLFGHPKIEKLIFPLHPSFPQFELAQKQMKGGGGLFSIILKTEEIGGVERFCNHLKHFLLAVSWGGHESLAFPFMAGFPKEEFNASNPDHRLVRLYIGLENPDYLLQDLHQALDQV
ncbi:MAG TPA: PLP-dependent aspartate aminotransferase family protein [Chitinophagaceae bacterium]|nr:PLP-dependent aspartate aminotransferase family protein [Chitinophagaceae bacterium]